MSRPLLTFLFLVKWYSNIYSSHFILSELLIHFCRHAWCMFLRLPVTFFHMSRGVRRPAFCICENKDADQLRYNREADLRLCFRYMDSTIPLLPKSEISSVQPSSVVAQPGLCRTWSETPKTGFFTTRLIFIQAFTTLDWQQSKMLMQ